MSEDDTLSLKSNESSHNFVCTTKMKFNTYNIRWTIENYDFVSKTVKVLMSPEFPLSQDESRIWYISFKPIEITINNEEEVEFRINRKIKTDKAVQAQISVSFENDSGTVFDDFGVYICSVTRYTFWTLSGKELHENLTWNEASNKSLIINCKIKVLDSTQFVCPKLSTKALESNNLIQDMSKFFVNDQTFQDITITVQEKTFVAHKAILAARSDVFAAMFTHEMSEKNNSLIEIKDLKPEVADVMLRFIYTDKVDDEDMKELAPELLGAADKYNLKRLKNMCATAMLKNMSVENVLNTLVVADIYSLSDLKKAALTFVVSHRRIVKSLEEFKTLVSERPHLMVEFIDIQDTIQDKGIQESQEESVEVNLDFRSNTPS